MEEGRIQGIFQVARNTGMSSLLSTCKVTHGINPQEETCLLFVVVSLWSKDTGLNRSFSKKVTVKNPILPSSPVLMRQKK